jgi:PAS domain S-box-containing protein
MAPHLRMLTEFLSEHPEIVRDVLSNEAAFQSTAQSDRTRRKRLRVLLAELTEMLHDADEHAPIAHANGDDNDLLIRSLLRREIVDKLDVEEASRELVLLSDWVWRSEHQRLAESNARKAALLDLSADAAVVVTLEGRILYANHAATQLVHKISGLIGEQIIGRTGRELGFFVESGPLPSEFPMLARTGTVRELLVSGQWYELRAVELPGTVDNQQTLGLTLTDIHERKISSIRLEMLSKLSRLVGVVDPKELWVALAQVPIPQLADWCAVSTFERGRLTSTMIAHRDPAKSKLRDEVASALSTLPYHPLWRDPIASGLQLLSVVSDDLLRRIVSNDDLYRLIAKIGITSLMVVPVVSRGETIAIVTFAYTADSGRRYGHDDPRLAVELALHAAHVAENSRLVAEAKASDVRFRIALAESRTMVYEQDASLRYIWHYGHDRSQYFVGKKHEDTMPTKQAEILTRMKQKVLDTGQPTSEEVELTFGGASRWYRETIEVVRDRNGARTGVIGAATDVTEQKQTQEMLKRAVELRDRVMGILGHDLRNPLTTMTMASSLLLHEKELSSDAHAAAVRIERAARRMTEMISTLLDFTRVRLSENPLPVTRRSAVLADIATEIVEESLTANRERTIEVEIEGDTRIMCDGPRIAQALSNLLANAMSYGDPSQPIHLAIEGGDTGIVLRIHNFGPPIAEAVLPTIFEPFVRGEQGTQQGLGLGLFVVREIVKSHGGSISVDSTAEDGTTFTIRLPRL